MMIERHSGILDSNRMAILFMVFALISVLSYSQTKPFISHPDQLGDSAYAHWIGPGGDHDQGVFYFRKQLQLSAKPDHFLIHLSGDNRYRFYVNDQLVSWGPAVGDLNNWNYESLDIAPFLQSGENILAAQVWTMGRLAGARQISHQTAFILQGASLNEQRVNTDRSWRVAKDNGYYTINISRATAGGGYIAAGTDSIDGRLHPWGWQKIDFDDSRWDRARELGQGNHSGLDTWKGTVWKLKEREIPVMEQKVENIRELLSVTGIDYALSANDGNLDMVIPPRSHVEVLLDNRVLTMGFPQLAVSGGSGSQVKIQYQESLFHEDGTKGNRDEWQGKEMKGCYDVFIPDGGSRLFEPRWIREFRYVKITVDTEEEPLTINGFQNVFTAYPFEQRGSFSSSNDTLQQIWDVSWRTVRLCALETYMDCPYYEQLQYIGDTRIQALISMYVAGDDRLVKNAITQLYGSMQPMGLTKSNHPSAGVQIIPPFSLLLIEMIHDYHMLRDDPQFVEPFIPGIKFILDWFVSRIDENGILGPLPYWNHIDGGTDFKSGSPPGISEGGSAHMTILLALVLEHAAEMLQYFGYDCESESYQKTASALKESVLGLCFDHEKHLMAETPAKQMYSQHTNAIAILADLFDPATETLVAEKLTEDSSLVQATLYFKFYVFQALKKAGLGNRVLDMMDEWQSFLDEGFTTFPEHGIESRSDCHAWSAHPMFDFLSITCGVESASPGFKEVEIRPNPGNVSHMECTVVHPHGEISVSYTREDHGETSCNIRLPDGVRGHLIYDHATFPLSAGFNNVLF